jgi:TPR repeat protein
VKQDYLEAERWYKLAAGQGDANAQFALGMWYVDGTGIVQNYAEAVRWYNLAAEQGYSSAQGNLGWMYEQGNGVVQDYVTAHMWYNLATAKGFDGATENRNNVAKLMTPAQIDEAQQRAQACLESNYKNC